MSDETLRKNLLWTADAVDPSEFAMHGAGDPVVIEAAEWGETVQIGPNVTVRRPLNGAARLTIEPLGMVALELHDRLVAIERKLGMGGE